MPPPPPPAPPPLPKQPSGGSNSQGKSSNFQPPGDRNALLSQIKKGTRLKHAETIDKSIPFIEGSRPSSNGAVKRNQDSKPNGPFPIIPPGGLFAQGIPKLRPTTPRSGDNSPSSLVIQSIKSGNSTSSLDHLRVGQLGGSRSQPPSPVSKPRLTSSVVASRTASLEGREHAHSLGGNPNFPDDISIKGPAPAPPPASQKPVFRSNTKIESPVDSVVKHPMVKRSASQTNLQRPRVARPPPNVKPPPPPKSSPCAPQTAPPPPPSKPPNILRRQSFGTGEGHNSRFAASKLSVANQYSPKPVAKGIGPPPPPPRNNSAPNDLNEMVTNSSPGNQWNKMNIAPPPPPPNRGAATSTRAPPLRPPPPRAPAPPPPPPQHQFPAPPSQMKATPSNLAPQPPTRVSSMKQSSEFEERFKNMFCVLSSLPKPDKFMNIQKSYPSKMHRQKQIIRRLPPPPPPQSRTNLADAGRGQPVIHIQLETGIFSNNVAHC